MGAGGVSIDSVVPQGTFHFSSDWKHVKHTTDDQQNIHIMVSATCASYRLTMHSYDAPKVSKNFAAGIQFLPANFVENTTSEHAYMSFINRFGTHYINQMTLGGRWGFQAMISASNYKKLLNDDVNIDIGISGVANKSVGFNFGLNSSTYD